MFKKITFLALLAMFCTMPALWAQSNILLNSDFSNDYAGRLGYNTVIQTPQADQGWYRNPNGGRTFTTRQTTGGNPDACILIDEQLDASLLQLINDAQTTTGQGTLTIDVYNGDSDVTYSIWGYNGTATTVDGKLAAVTNTHEPSGGSFDGLIGSGTISATGASWGTQTVDVDFGSGYDYILVALSAPGNSTTNSLIDNVTLQAGSTPVLSSGWSELQLGLSGIGNPIFTNAMISEGEYWVNGSYKNKKAPIGDQFNAVGLPKYLENGEYLSMQLENNYSGRVAIQWEGDADIQCATYSAVYVAGQSTPETGVVNNGVRLYDLPEGQTTLKVEIYALGTQELTSLEVYVPDPHNPGQTQDQSKFFNPDYLALLETIPNGVYRFMDWNHTNNSPVKYWSERRQTDFTFQKGYNTMRIEGTDTIKVDAGIAYEHMIALCNEMQRDMWINVPHLATDGFIDSLAMLINGDDPDGTGCPGLDPNLRVYVEYSNECWNGMFDVNAYAKEQAALLGIDWEVFIARRFCDSWQIFENHLGSDGRVVRVLAGFSASASYVDKLITEVNNYGPTLTPAVAPDAVALATYFDANISTYVFEKGYWRDPYDNNADDIFREWEYRLLSGADYSSGNDFTGGGAGFKGEVAQVVKDAGIPIIGYEGITGIRYDITACVIGCEVVDGSVDGAVCKRFPGAAEICETGGNQKFRDYINSMRRDPRFADVCYVNNSIAKANGMRTMSQFGDIGGPGGEWGGFYLLESLLDTNMFRVEYQQDWVAEQENINEVLDSVGTRPYFTVDSKLPLAKAGEYYSYNITFDGGEGTLTAKQISKGYLPAGLNIDYQSNAIQISGTPTEDGAYAFLFRVTDGDNDPAYGVFTLKVLPAQAKNILVAHDDFGSVNTDADGAFTGFGYSGTWFGMNGYVDSTTIIETVNPLTYTNLDYSAEGYLAAAQSITRGVDAGEFDYLENSSQPGKVGEPGTSVWMSTMIMLTADYQDDEIIPLADNDQYKSWFSSDQRLVLGTSNGNWAIWVKSTESTYGKNKIETTIPANIGTTNLIVTEIDYTGVYNVVRLWVNPTSLGGAAPAADFEYTLTDTQYDIIFNCIGILGVAPYGSALVDDIRFGDSYQVVTPYNENKRAKLEEALMQTVKVYPNPVDGETVTIALNGYEADCRTRLSITDLSGRILWQQEVYGNTLTEIATNQFQTGVYLVQINNAQTNQVNKLIIK